MSLGWPGNVWTEKTGRLFRLQPSRPDKAEDHGRMGEWMEAAETSPSTSTFGQSHTQRNVCLTFDPNL